MNISKTKAVVLPACNENLIRGLLSLQVKEVDIPDLKEDEVLVEMLASPVNPSDIALMRGMYNFRKPEPFIPGFEGYGTVIKTAHEKYSDIIGKRVCCYTRVPGTGTWAEYFVARIKDCIVIDERIPIEQAACMAINPYTAMGLLEIIRKQQCGSVIQSAASGQVGRLVRMLCREHGIRVINIIRKPENIALLQSEGEEFALCSSAPDFYTTLSGMANDLDARVALDAAGGELTGQLMNAMPPDSVCVLYGGLSGNPVSGINSLDVIFRHKLLRGFNLNEYIASLDKTEFDRISAYFTELVLEGRYKTPIAGTFELQEVVGAIRAYIKNMSAGKVLLVSQGSD